MCLHIPLSLRQIHPELILLPTQGDWMYEAQSPKLHYNLFMNTVFPHIELSIYYA